MKKTQTSYDEPVKLKDIPLMTIDGVAIKINSVIYIPNIDSYGGKRGRDYCAVKAERVIYLNTHSRNYRTRDNHGVEATRYPGDVAQSRSRLPVYGKFANAVRLLKKLHADNMKHLDAEIKEVQKKKSILVDSWARFTNSGPPPIPKELKLKNPQKGE